MPEWLKIDQLTTLNLETRNWFGDASVVVIELGLILTAYFVLSGLVAFIQKRLDSVVSLAKIAGRVRSIVSSIRLILRLLLALGLMLVIGMNAYQFYLGQDLQIWTLAQSAKIPPGFWKGLGINFAKAVVLIWGARLLIKRLQVIFKALEISALNYKQLSSNNAAVNEVFDRLINMQRIIVWLLVLIIVVRISPLPDGLTGYLWTILSLYLIVSIALLVVNTIAVIVDSLDGLSLRYATSTGVLGFYQSLRHLVPVLRRTLEYLLYAAATTLVLKQLDFIADLAEYGGGVIQGIGVLFLARVAVEVMNVLIDRQFLHDALSEDEISRNHTIYPIFKSVMAGLIYFIAIVLIMRGFGFDPIPLLAGAGILGMVIGLGAQQFISNLVSGFAIIFEQVYQVGDFIQVQEAKGVVEQISLRTTRVRSPDGELHILENGKLGDIVNFSNQYTNAVVEIGIDSGSDLNKAYRLLAEVGSKLRSANEAILGGLQIDGIEDFSGPELLIRTRTKVQPGQHAPVARLIRQEVVQIFEREGIHIPFEKRYKMA